MPGTEERVILCDTMTVSGVTHSSYFQRDLLISTVVTFGHPETGYYIAPLLIPTSHQCDTMTVSGVTHRRYFQRDLLISTVVTFGHPETGYYILVPGREESWLLA